jgi:hypothetical protein
LHVIQHVLKKGGVWINVGPIQWHRGALLHPSVDELKDLIEGRSSNSNCDDDDGDGNGNGNGNDNGNGNGAFEIVDWSVDVNPIPYRQEEQEGGGGGEPFVRTTNYEAYRPLRFVAIRK